MKTAKVFRQGNSQAVRLPKEFRFQEDEVFIRKNGDNVLLIPKKTERWKHVKACLGKFKGTLERSQADTLIAAHAVSLEMTLVTHNVREFSRVSGLKVENWAAA